MCTSKTLYIPIQSRYSGLVHELRRYPRVPLVTSRFMTRLSGLRVPQTNLIMTENMSACGVCLSSLQHVDAGSRFLIELTDAMVHDVESAGLKLVRCGNFFYCEAVWANAGNGLHRIGASFFERTRVRSHDLDQFIELMNAKTLEQLV